MTIAPSAPALPDIRDRQCLAALFFTYTFDRVFFEESVLPSFVPVSSDPHGEPARFLSEATAAITQVPVVVVADASVATRSRRLPYDLLLVSRRTFHPKLTVLVYENSLSVRIASGNLTRSGYGGNAELFVEVELRPDRPEHVDGLRDLAILLDLVQADLPALTPQWREVREAISAQIARISVESGEPVLRLLYPQRDRCLLDRLWEHVPEDATFERVGIIAPFFELDCAESTRDIDGFIAELSRRAGPSAAFDLVCPWDRQEPLVKGPKGTMGHTPGWWEEKSDPDDSSNWTYFATTGESTTSGYVIVRDRQRKRVPYTIEDMDHWLEEGCHTALPQPAVHLPAHLLTRLARQHSTAVWLHPSTRTDGKRVHRQPLHAKALAITTVRRGRRTTLLAVGSANASRKAWTLDLNSGANAELIAVVRRDDEVSVTEIDPWIVHCPISLIQASERAYPERPFDPASVIESAVYDPSLRRLTIAWSSTPPQERSWRLLYASKELAQGPRVPPEHTLIENMEFQPGVLILEVDLGGQLGQVPIQVTDPIHLPMPGSGTGYALEDLIRLMGHAVGRGVLEERYTESGSSSPGVGRDDDDAQLRPTEIFKAWWALAADLAVPGITPRSTNILIDGPTGARRTWRALRERVERGGMDRHDAWFFGAELAREISRVDLQNAVRAQERRQIIDAFVAEIRNDLAALDLSTKAAWTKHLMAFYGQKAAP